MLENYNESSVVVAPKTTYVNIGMAVVLVVVTLVIGGVYLWMQKTTHTAQTMSETDTAEVTASGSSNFVFTYSLVPDAEKITSIPLVNDTDFFAADRARYEAIIATPSAMMSGEETNDTLNSPYKLKVSTLGILTVLEQHESNATLMQIHDELLALTNYHNSLLKRKSPVERGVADAVVLPYENQTLVHSPSTDVVLGLFFTDILKQTTIEGSDVSTLDAQFTALVEQGIRDGLYSESDVEMSKSMYEAYKKALLINYPVLASTF